MILRRKLFNFKNEISVNGLLFTDKNDFKVGIDMKSQIKNNIIRILFQYIIRDNYKILEYKNEFNLKILQKLKGRQLIYLRFILKKVKLSIY